MRILTDEGAGLTRRTRFIAAASFALGIGVILRPEWGAKKRTGSPAARCPPPERAARQGSPRIRGDHHLSRPAHRSLLIAASRPHIPLLLSLLPFAAAAKNHLWPVDARMKDGTAGGRAKKSIREAIILILETGFCFGAVVAFILNGIIPLDSKDPETSVHNHGYSRPKKEVEALDTANEAASAPEKEKVVDMV